MSDGSWEFESPHPHRKRQPCKRLSFVVCLGGKKGLKMTPNSLFRRLGIEVPPAKSQLLHGDYGDHVIAFYRKESLLIDDYNKGNDSQGSH